MAEAVAAGGAVVPVLFRWEMQNGLLFAFKRKRIDRLDIREHLEALDALNLRIDEAIVRFPFNAGLEFAMRSGLSAYDAAYLELAIRTSGKIMTRDERLHELATELNLLWNGTDPYLRINKSGRLLTRIVVEPSESAR